MAAPTVAAPTVTGAVGASQAGGVLTAEALAKQAMIQGGFQAVAGAAKGMGAADAAKEAAEADKDFANQLREDRKVSIVKVDTSKAFDSAKPDSKTDWSQSYRVKTPSVPSVAPPAVQQSQPSNLAPVVPEAAPTDPKAAQQSILQGAYGQNAQVDAYGRPIKKA